MPRFTMRSCTLAAAAALAFAVAPIAAAQSTSTNDPSHIEDARKATEPGAAQNDPSRGAYDPARVGTSTRSNTDLNNNRNPERAPQQAIETTSPVAMEPLPPSETYAGPAAPAAPRSAPPAPVVTAQAVPAPMLPKTASSTPLVGLVGLSAFAAALALRARR